MEQRWGAASERKASSYCLSSRTSLPRAGAPPTDGGRAGTRRGVSERDNSRRSKRCERGTVAEEAGRGTGVESEGQQSIGGGRERSRCRD
ncbi:hypothetical protein CLOM_g16802 [Closterium sp. NIES-68]|nr:hypothetical protein CLOM_g16802 [Closterium sp. NIES-68]